MGVKIIDPNAYGSHPIPQPTGTAQVATTSSSSITSTQVNTVTVALNQLIEDMATLHLRKLGAT